MVRKPLMRYNPEAQRSQLPKPTIVMPYKNSSTIVIGDRSRNDQRQFKTTNGLFQKWPNFDNRTTNNGIVAAEFKRAHNYQNKDR